MWRKQMTCQRINLWMRKQKNGKKLICTLSRRASDCKSTRHYQQNIATQNKTKKITCFYAISARAAESRDPQSHDQFVSFNTPPNGWLGGQRVLGPTFRLARFENKDVHPNYNRHALPAGSSTNYRLWSCSSCGIITWQFDAQNDRRQSQNPKGTTVLSLSWKHIFARLNNQLQFELHSNQTNLTLCSHSF